jgi:biotin carboxylase
MKKLAILGASYLQLPLVEKAKQMGVETHCFAWDNDLAVCKKAADFFYPISVLDKEAILAICKEINVDGITTIATDICIPTINYVAESMNLIGNSISSGFLATNKAAMRAAFEKGCVLSPKSITVQEYSVSELSDFSFPLIVKPTDRSGSRGVSKVVNSEELEFAIARALSESLEKKVVVEEFIEGVEVSVESISWEGTHHVLQITDKITTEAPYFVELEHHQPSLLSNTIQIEIRKQTQAVLEAVAIKYGASHAEFKITKQGKVYAIEVGARMGGDFIGSDLVELSTGYDFVKAVISIALGSFETPVLSHSRASGVYFLSTNSNRLLPLFDSINEFEVKKELFSKELKEIKDSNDRSGYLMYQSQSRINL